LPIIIVFADKFMTVINACVRNSDGPIIHSMFFIYMYLPSTASRREKMRPPEKKIYVNVPQMKLAFPCKSAHLHATLEEGHPFAGQFILPLVQQKPEMLPG